MGDPRRISKSRPSRRVALAAGLLVAAVSAPLIALSAATPASADVQVCGVPQGEPTAPGGEPTVDLNGVLQLTAQGNQVIIDEIRNAFDLGTEWCGPLKDAIDVGADLVAGTVWERVEIDVPLQYDVVIAVAETEWKRLQGAGSPQAPTETQSLSPAGGPSQLAQDASGTPGVSASVAWTGGIGLNLRPSPDRTGASLGIAPDGATVTIGCTARGETITGPNGPTDLWDYVSYDGQTGYVSDGWVDTGTSDPAAPSC